MKKLTIICLAVAMLGAGCATIQQGTPLQQAEASYVEASIAYDALMNVASTGCTQGLFPTATCKQAAAVQDSVIKAQPAIRALLDVWKSTGQKPAGFGNALAILIDAVAKLSAAFPVKGVTP